MVIFTTLETFRHLLEILFRALLVRTLNASSGRGVITCCSETYHRAVRQVERPLHQAFSERTTAYQNTSVPVLDSTRHDFTCRCAALINEDHESAFTETAVLIGHENLFRGLQTFSKHYHFIFSKELIAKSESCLQIAAAVASQIEDKRLHPLAFQVVQSFLKLIHRLLCEFVKLDIPDFLVNHEICVDAVQRYFISNYFKINKFRVITTFDAEHYFCAFHATKMLGDIFVVHFLSKSLFPIDGDDSVACHDADLLRRATRDR